MSRSRKKTPYSTDNSGKDLKRVANKRIRRLLKNPDIDLRYKSYKKAYPSWDICDFRFYGEDFEKFYKKQIIRWKYRRLYSFWQDEKMPTRKECWQMYLKWYLRK